MTKTILVTGGAGFIGSHLVDALVQAGYRVRVLDNLEPQVHGDLAQRRAWPDYANPAAEYILGDVRELDMVAQAVEGAAAVYHLAAGTGVGQSMYQIARYTAANVQGTANLLEALARRQRDGNPVEHLVLSSSRAVYGEGLYTCARCGPVSPPVRTAEALERKSWEPACPNCGGPLVAVLTPETMQPAPGSIYAATKHSQEQLALLFGRAYQTPVTVLRFFNVYGPRQSLSNPYTGILSTFLGRLLNGLPAQLYEDGQMTRDFVYVSDVVRACLLALESKASGVFNVGSGQFTTIREVAETLTDLVCPGVAPEVVGLARIGDIRHCSADLRRTEEALGYRPAVSLREGLAVVAEEARASAASQPVTDLSACARDELKRAGLLK